MTHSIAATFFAATIVLFATLLCSCEGRKMSNMEPRGETVEVDITPAPAQPADSIM